MPPSYQSKYQVAKSKVQKEQPVDDQKLKQVDVRWIGINAYIRDKNKDLAQMVEIKVVNLRFKKINKS